MGNENMAIHNNSFTKSNCANHRRIPRRTIREGFLLNDYITEILKRLKPCVICKTPFLDLTYNQNRKYCSKQCREVIGNIYDRERMRNIRRKQHILGKPLTHSLGTFTQTWLDKRIYTLHNLYNQRYTKTT
jgi:predicted nucleic acid-binding Zn ribbon protein